MSEPQQPDFTCAQCDAPVTQENTYCKNCGTLFSDNVYCSHHPSVEAVGVCVICSEPFCKKCGGESNRIFLCNSHWHYEIQEGMARVFGSTDNTQAQYVTSCLEQEGYHPFLYSRRINPGADLVAIGRIVRNYGNHPIEELKVLVPFSEVLNAEKTMKKLDLST